MLMILVYDPPVQVSFFKRLHRRFFWPAIVTEDRILDGIQLRYLFCNPYCRIHWKKVREISHDSPLLLPDQVDAPESIALNIVSDADCAELSAAAAIQEVLQKAALDPKRCRMLFYDRKGSELELAQSLSSLCNEMMVVSENLNVYEDWVDDLLDKTGKPVRLSTEMPDGHFTLLIAPAGFDRVVRTDPGIVVFTSGKQNLPQNGLVYYQYYPAIPEEWRKLCPKSTAWERFYPAILAAGKGKGAFCFPLQGCRQRICTDSVEQVIRNLNARH